MRQYRFVQYDVFTDVPFGGNQLAVITDATGLSDDEMQSIAREMNYSETTFVLPATDVKAVRRVRIFTPGTELPIAGHPTIGTTYALAHERVVRSGDALPVYLQLGIGTLPVDLLFEGEELSFVWMHQPVPQFLPWSGDAPRLLEALGLEPDDLSPMLPIEQGSAGVPFIYVPLRTTHALAKAEPGNPSLSAAMATTEATTGLYLFSCEVEEGKESIRRSRMFGLELGIAEDAATGVAAGPFAVYLLRNQQIRPDHDGEVRLHIRQGVEMGRPSLLKVGLTCATEEAGEAGEPVKVLDVRVGGESILIAEGTILLP